MKISILITFPTLSTILGLAFAAAIQEFGMATYTIKGTPSNTTSVEEVPPGSGVYFCPDKEWGHLDHRENLCAWISARYFDEGAAICINFVDGYDNTISSFGPDRGLKCTVYDFSYCTGPSLDIWWPGYADMSWNGWDNRVSSYRCAGA
ncbi:hypothetical protein BU16DRAFT_235198 [Lophium mytilinum]|uniref:Uncharacterized protein n=1 Tax=Lophium mytilinum TaxID=390894 RepID=A0A6A6R9A7_9PEZI|nr:hypothetical protein BU16DRAFT_235198 [Lophium mytilinum]